jgi:hypothetical protein
MTDDVKCPICGSATVIRTAKKGSDSGKQFHLCSRYPECKGRVRIVGGRPRSDRLSVEREEKETSEEKLEGYIRGWSWGAFLLTWIWGIGNRVWISLLCFIPIVNWVMPFVLGAYGNRWAWEKGGWRDLKQFRRTQRQWAFAGLALFLVVIIIDIIVITAD